jgi:hypothetical protein
MRPWPRAPATAPTAWSPNRSNPSAIRGRRGRPPARKTDPASGGCRPPAPSWASPKLGRRAEAAQDPEQHIGLGHDVALDLGLWSRKDRDGWKALITTAGARWRLLYFPVPRAELSRRLAERNGQEHANALRVLESDLDDFIARFEEPTGEGEQIIQPDSY